MGKQRVWMTAVLALLAGSAGSLVGCAHAKIAGTEIDDTKDTRAILAVMERFRSALEAKDVHEVHSLLSSKFRESGGTSSPDDDLDYENLETRMAPRMSRIQDVRLSMDVKRVEVKGAVASAVYYFNANYKLPTYTSKVQADSDLKQMQFVREGGMWRILGGI